MGERILIEEGSDPVSHYHFVLTRAKGDSPASRRDVEQVMIRNGCTKIYHLVPSNPDAPLFTYGEIERLDVVSQRVNKVTR